MARLNVSVVATGIPEEVNKYKIVFLKLQKPKNIWTKKMSCRQFLERGCPQPSGSPPFPGSASIRQVISSTQDNTLPHTEAKATFFRHLPMQRSAPVRSSSQGQGNFRRWSSRNHQVSLHEGDDRHWSWFSATIQKLLNQVYDFPDDQPDLVVGRRSDCMIALKICFQPRFTSTPTTNQTWSLSYPLLVSPSSSSW